jgi:hypothetical protein
VPESRPNWLRLTCRAFSRQTGLACSACHYQFLTLTPFGREFKLNGYTLTRQQVIKEKDKSKGEQSLSLSPIPLVAAMLQASVTHTKDAQPGTQNDNAELPQQLERVPGGRAHVQDRIFTQFTYSGADGSFGIDNIDLRFANKTKLGSSTDMVYGVSLNNNPTVQDLWNTTPAWGFPFASSDVAPTGAASTEIDGALAQQALGFGAYTMVAKTVYAEFSVYRSAMQGRALPDSFAISGVAPYWRLGLQKTWENQYVMVGTYGMHINQFPGLCWKRQPDRRLHRHRHRCAGRDQGRCRQPRGPRHLDSRRADLPCQFPGGCLGEPSGCAQGVPAEHVVLSQDVARPYPRLLPDHRTVDAVRYAPAPVSGSANGDPKTNGFIGEVDLNPWQNTRLGVQYTLYDRFNGGKDNYDAAGRRASGNNTLYLLAWVVF